MTSKQLAYFRERWAGNFEFAGGHGNNRAIQPVNGRTIKLGTASNYFSLARDVRTAPNRVPRWGVALVVLVCIILSVQLVKIFLIFTEDKKPVEKYIVKDEERSPTNTNLIAKPEKRQVEGPVVKVEQVKNDEKPKDSNETRKDSDEKTKQTKESAAKLPKLTENDDDSPRSLPF